MMRLYLIKRTIGNNYRCYSSNNLSHLHVKGTLSCLKSQYWDFSPAIGLLNSAAPSLLANTRQVNSMTNDMAKDLFYQRNSKGKRYGPLAIANSKSLPIKWLNLQQIGHILGLASLQNKRHRQHLPLLDANHLDNELKKCEIFCNYVHDTWTGISYARYRKMINQIAWCIEEQHLVREKYENNFFIPPNYGLLSLTQCVWEKASTKEDILMYFQAIQEAIDEEIFTPSFQQQQGTSMNVWKKDIFSHEDISSGLDLSWNNLFFLLPDRNEEEQIDLARSLEIVTASLAVQASFKGAIRQGRYSYHSPYITPSGYQQQQDLNDINNDLQSKLNKVTIPTRPDCVEVVVREIIDNLIYDTSTGKLDISVLPLTAHPALRRYYERFLSEEINDIPFAAQRTDEKNPTSTTHYSEGQNTSAGEAWFQVCCNLPHGEYLCHVEYDINKTSENPSTNYIPKIHLNASKPTLTNDGKTKVESYELAPSLKNVCTILGQLLNHTNLGDIGEKTAAKQWTRLEHLASFWNDHIHSMQTNEASIVQNSNIITVQESRSIFRAPLSDTEMIYRDIGFIHIGKSRFLLQAELEPAHQLAAVKYIRASHILDGHQKQSVDSSDNSANTETLWQQSQVLHNKLFTDTNTPQDLSVRQREWKALFQSILFPNEPSVCHNIQIPSSHSDTELSTITLQNQFLLLQHRLVSGKYGEEKWKPDMVTQMGDIAFTQSTMSLSLAAQANAQYTTLLTDKLMSLVEMARLIVQMKTVSKESSVHNDSGNGDSIGPLTSNTKQGMKTKKTLNNNRAAANVSAITSFHQLSTNSQVWEKRWSELAQWLLVDVHSDLTTESLETFIRSMGALLKSTEQTSGVDTKEMNVFMQSFFLPYLLQYRGSQDGLYLSYLCSLMTQPEESKVTLMETVFSSESAMKRFVNFKDDMVPAATEKKMTLTLSQRWKLLRYTISS